jgi:hypothetical protein
MKSHDQLTSLGEDSDRADASAIVDVYRALTRIRESHSAFAGRTARESVQKIWQEPRMPRPRYKHNKPLDYPWTLAARDAYFEGRARGQLVLEHVTPINHMVSLFFDRVADPDFGVDDMLTDLREMHRGFSFAIITKVEDDRLTAAGLRSKRSAEDSAWSRYEVALGANADGFGAITDDPRYTAAR